MLRATVSGSFHRHMSEVSSAVQELAELGIQILSPADPRIVDQRGVFLFVASDRVRSIRMVQDRHLEAIRQSDFLWLVTPDGYVGQSASMEIGFAVAAGTPVFGSSMPRDLTLRRYMQLVGSPTEAIRCCGSEDLQLAQASSFLLDPDSAIQEAHDRLVRVETILRRPPARISDRENLEIRAHRTRVADLMV